MTSVEHVMDENPSEFTGETDSPDTRRRWLPAPYALSGLIGALGFAVISFFPSLLPRTGFFQGLITGVTAAIGYALGLIVAFVVREVADRSVRPTLKRSWQIFGAVAVVLLLVSVNRGQHWQGQIRDLMGIPTPGSSWILVLPMTAMLTFILLIALARLIRSAYRWLSRLLDRWMGARAARVLGFAVILLAVGTLLSDVFYDGFIRVADQVFSVRNGITPEGIEQPTSPLRSAGEGSQVSWESLGREGRKFVASGPSAGDISALTGVKAIEPIRTYAGLETADDAEARARLAVDDLERAGGFKRKSLLVATTTGSGWIDPASVDTFEYLEGGDTSIVSIQYSYLPSWLSFLVDQRRAREAGRELFDAVYERWLALPEDQRPKLYVFGESLGSFGGEAAFSGEFDMRNRTDGIVFAGPPNVNAQWSEFISGRDEGSPEVLPTYRAGRTVRFASEPAAGIPPTDEPWESARVVYLQHSSDPIVWWSPDLLLNEPDWLTEPKGPDVLDEVRWAPFVTFWQLTLDLPLAVEVPPGHGHTYSREYVDAWAGVLRSNASASMLKELRDLAAVANS